MNREKSQTKPRLTFIVLGLLNVLLWSPPALAAGVEPRTLVAGTPIRLPLIEGKDIRFTLVSTQQGLAQSRVDHMLQDRRGFIWIGTYNGLNRYDGYRLRTCKPVSNNSDSLAACKSARYSRTDPGSCGSAPTQGLDRFDPATDGTEFVGTLKQRSGSTQ